MRKLILIAGLAVAVAAPSFASAKTACERSRSDKRVVGTVAGGVLGALAGAAVARDDTAGVLIGGTAGAVAGNQLTKGRPCPSGYVAREYREPVRTTRARNAAPQCSWENQTYRDSDGALVRRQVQVCR